MQDIAVAKKRLNQAGISEETIWKGITKHVKETCHRDFAEITELSADEGKAVLDYLDAWDKYLKSKAAAAAKGN